MDLAIWSLSWLKTPCSSRWCGLYFSFFFVGLLPLFKLTLTHANVIPVRTFIILLPFFLASCMLFPIFKDSPRIDTKHQLHLSTSNHQSDWLDTPIKPWTEKSAGPIPGSVLVALNYATYDIGLRWRLWCKLHMRWSKVSKCTSHTCFQMVPSKTLQESTRLPQEV